MPFPLPEPFVDDPRLQRNFDAIALALGSLQGSLSGQRTISGAITTAGAVLRGVGFTASRAAAGDYTITFTTAFPGTPSVVATTEQASGTWTLPNIIAVSGSSVRIQVLDTIGGVKVDERVNFQATYRG